MQFPDAPSEFVEAVLNSLAALPHPLEKKTKQVFSSKWLACWRISFVFIFCLFVFMARKGQWELSNRTHLVSGLDIMDLS